MDALWDLHDFLDGEIHVATQTPPKRMRRTAGKQTYSSDWHRVHQACKWAYLTLVLQVHAPSVVYNPLDGNAH